jgi:hypothetical protein
MHSRFVLAGLVLLLLALTALSLGQTPPTPSDSRSFSFLGFPTKVLVSGADTAGAKLFRACRRAGACPTALAIALRGRYDGSAASAACRSGENHENASWDIAAGSRERVYGGG